MSRQIFYDPQRRRWKRLRRILDGVAVVSTLLLVAFFLNAIHKEELPELLLPLQKRNYRALKLRQPSDLKGKAGLRPGRGKTNRKPSDIPLNTGEGLRAAYYVDDDPASYSSLKAHIHQIDMLFPEWLHVTDAAGTLQGAVTTEFPSRTYNIVDPNGTVHGVDPQDKVRHAIVAAHEDTEVFPLLQNYNVLTQSWDRTVGAMLKSDAARRHLEAQLGSFFAENPAYHGLSLDLEDLPDDAFDGYHALITEMGPQLRAKGLRLYVNTSVSADEEELRLLARDTDGILLMNYDQHEPSSGPGPIASQDWFEANLQRVLKVVPKQKLICAVG